MGVNEMFEQMSLFFCDSQSVAVSCFTGSEVHAEALEPWMKNIIPNGEFYVLVGNRPLVLKPTKLKKSSVPKGHEYYHYAIGSMIYSGVFVGRECNG